MNETETRATKPAAMGMGAYLANALRQLDWVTLGERDHSHAEPRTVDVVGVAAQGDGWPLILVKDDRLAGGVPRAVSMSEIERVGYREKIDSLPSSGSNDGVSPHIDTQDGTQQTGDEP